MAEPTSILLAVGAGAKALNSVLEFNQIQEQKRILDAQIKMQLAQNKASAGINEINLLQQANKAYDTNLVNQSVSGASLGSGSFANINNSIYSAEMNKDFVNQANLNAINLNTLFQTKNQQTQLNNMQNSLLIGGLSDLTLTGMQLYNKKFTKDNDINNNSLFNIK